MKKLHVEFDLIVTDRDAEELLNAPVICTCDNIANALEVYDDCESIEDFKMYKVEKDDERN